jgi:hypothetical protein
MTKSDAADEKAGFFAQLHLVGQTNDNEEDDEGFNAVEEFLANSKPMARGHNIQARSSGESLHSLDRKQGGSSLAISSRASQDVRIYKSALMGAKATPLSRHDRISRSLSFPKELNPSKVEHTSSLHSSKPPTLKATSSAPPLLSASSYMSSRKRAKKDSLQLVPDGRQVFKDLNFCI